MARPHLELAAHVRDEGAVVVPDDVHAGELAERHRKLVGVILVAQLDRDLTDRLEASDGDRVHVADQPSLLADPQGDPRELARLVRDPQAVGAVH